MSQIISQLLNNPNLEQQLSPSLSQVKHEQLSILIIKHSTCTAALSLQGGHLLFWQPTQATSSVLWLSERTEFKIGTAIRGGIPICWPWFNKLGGQPSHGFARISLWQLVEHKEDAAGVTLTLSLQDTPESYKLWPHHFNLCLTVQLGTTCRVELESSGDYQATSALHSYFTVQDIDQVKVSQLGDTYKESLSTVNPPKKQGEMTFDQAVDRIYSSTATMTPITDKQRTIRVSHLNASDVVVWNPWQENSIAMKDMADNGYKTMVCVETARISQPLQVTPQHSQRFGVQIEVE